MYPLWKTLCRCIPCGSPWTEVRLADHHVRRDHDASDRPSGRIWEGKCPGLRLLWFWPGLMSDLQVLSYGRGPGQTTLNKLAVHHPSWPEEIKPSRMCLFYRKNWSLFPENEMNAMKDVIQISSIRNYVTGASGRKRCPSSTN